MKTIKIPDLKSLIKKQKFNYVNSNITETNFPKPDRFSTDYKVFIFDRYILSEDVIKEMEKEGYVPANIYELLSYTGKETWLIALGSACVSGGYLRVLCLCGSGSGRELRLDSFDGDWSNFCRFVGVRKSELSPKTLGTSPLDTLSLETRVKKLEERLNKLNLI